MQTMLPGRKSLLNSYRRFASLHAVHSFCYIVGCFILLSQDLEALK